MNVNAILIFILIAILSVGGYFIWTENRIPKNKVNYLSQPSLPSKVPQNIKIQPIVIPKKSIEFSIFKKQGNEYAFSGIFSKEDTPKILVKKLDMKNLKHEIYINPELKYDETVIILGKKLLKELVNNYIEGSIVYKNNKLLITGSVKEKKDIEVIDDLLAYYSSVNSFNSTDVYTFPTQENDLDSETVNIISNLVKTVDNGEEKIADYLKPKIITKEKIIVKYRKPKVIIKYKEKPPIIKKIIKEKIVIKKEPVIKEKVIIKYVPVPVVKKPKEKSPEITEEDYIKNLNRKAPDKDIMSLPPVEVVDMNIEEKIKKGEMKPLRTTKPLVKQETIYIPPSNKHKIDKKIPWANLYEMDEKLNGVVYDDVVAGPKN